MSTVIPREQSEGFQRWELSSFDRPASALPPGKTLLSGNEPGNNDPTAKAPLTLPTAEEIERIHTQAHEEGFRQGYAEGLAQGQEAAQSALHAETTQVADLVANFATALNGLDQDIAEDVLALSIELARQMVGSSLQVRQENLLPVIREALAALPLHHGTVMLHIHPDDAEMVRTHFGEHLTHGGWRIIEDREIQRGGCRLTSGSSEVDATVASRWRQILEAIGAKPDWLEPSP